jgi:hypothetical protein
MIVAHPWHELRNLSTTRPLTTAAPKVAADHRFSEEDLVDLLSALRARAASHPDNPGLVACWPAVPAERMAAACRLLARRGHSVQPVPVAGWEPEKIRDGWTLGTPLHDLPPAPDQALRSRVSEIRDPGARADTDRWTNEGGGLEADARRPALRR